MAEERTDEEKLADVLRRDPRYHRDAYRFVQESLDFARQRLRRRGHVTGQELAAAVRDLALERFGLLARPVLGHWGVNSTQDIGNLVFNMIDAQIMVKRDSDSREDFHAVYDFDHAFEQRFQIELEANP